MSVPIDHLTYNRLGVAAALRRLADTATLAAELYAGADCLGEEDRQIRAVLGRVDSVKNALVIVHATREGIIRASRIRGAA